jgi:small basic protein (TIGR04137 family)
MRLVQPDINGRGHFSQFLPKLKHCQPVQHLLYKPLVFPKRNKHLVKFMSQHRSLRAAATLGGKRNVLKRFERVELLKKRGQWKSGDRITGLRKTKPDA